MKPEIGNERSYSAEFMLGEYERLYTVKMNEDGQAEQRVNLFFTIASAAVGVIVLLSQVSSISTEVMSMASLGILLVLLLFGLVILNRLNARVPQQRAIAQLLAEIRNYFANSDPEIAAYLDAHRRAFQGPIYRFRVVSRVLDLHRGTLTDAMILSNGLLSGGIALVALSSGGYPLSTVVVWTIATVVGSMILLHAYHQCAKELLRPFSI